MYLLIKVLVLGVQNFISFVMGIFCASSSLNFEAWVVREILGIAKHEVTFVSRHS